MLPNLTETIAKLAVDHADQIIVKAMQTPYIHLPGYMDRYWLVPYKEAGSLGSEGVQLVDGAIDRFRWMLQQQDIAARVHHILRSDDARDFHNHPWPYTTIILKGGYWEVVPVYTVAGVYIGDSRTWRGPGSVLIREAKSLHRLEVVEGVDCWTLFITGKYEQKWGFVKDPSDPASIIPYNEYLANPTDTKEK